MTNIHPNWNALNEKGVVAVSAVTGNTLQVSRLDKDLALAIGHAFLQKLDELGSRKSYGSFTLQAVQQEAERRLEDGEEVVFGELRPADRNCALSVRHERDDSYSLAADVRNDFEDYPELNGGKLMQQKFTETIESLEL